jgi:Cof subfamily protein (haloacid dehalogenase superfamily)
VSRESTTDAAAGAPQAIAAVLADVDGTLVTNAKELTPRAIEAVKKLHERGVLFAITSGRPPRGMRMLVEPLDLRGPIAAFNGGIVVMPDLTVVSSCPIPAEVAPSVVNAIRSHGLDVWVYRDADWYVTDPRGPHVDRESRTVQFQPTVVSGYDGLLDRAVKIVGITDDLDLAARCEADLRSRFGTHVSAARSQPYYVDVTHPTANKGVVVERLSHDYNVPLRLVATLGDQPNDVLMFVRSGLSIAMGNASEDVRRQATFVTASNQDEGFAKAVEEFILPRAVSAAAGLSDA